MNGQRHLQSVSDPDADSSGGSGGGGGGGFEKRLTSLETHFQYLATKEDLQKMKVWWLCGIIAGMALAATIALTFLRIFSSS